MHPLRYAAPALLATSKFSLAAAAAGFLDQTGDALRSRGEEAARQVMPDQDSTTGKAAKALTGSLITSEVTRTNKISCDKLAAAH